MDALRVALSEQLLPYVGDGFVTLDSLVGESDSVEAAVERQIDQSLRASNADHDALGEARIELVARTFIEAEGQQLCDLLKAINAAFARRRTSSSVIDVILLLQDLFPEVRGHDEAAKATTALLHTLDAARRGFERIGFLRFWLLDGQADNGLAYAIDDVAGVLKRFDPHALESALTPQAMNYFSFGARVVTFPRARMIDYLGSRFAADTLDRESWLDGAQLAFATIAHECSDFIVDDLKRALSDMERDEQGKPLVVSPSPPPLSGEESASTNLARITGAVETHVSEELEGIQAKLVANRDKAVAELELALTERVDRCLDTDPGRVVMAEAILDMLQTSTSPVATGDQVETGRPRTLAQGFSAAFEFFDAEAGFDSSKRAHLSELREVAAEQERWKATMETELATAKGKQSAGDEVAAAEIEALSAQMATLAEQAAQTADELENAAKEVKAQDWEIQTNRKELQRSMLAQIESNVAEARGAVDDAAGKVETARDAARHAEVEMSTAIHAIALRCAGLVLGLLLLGLLGTLLLPLAFGAAPLVGGPLFGFIGTAVGAVIFKIWAAVSLVSAGGYIVAQARRYLRLKKKSAECERELEGAKAAYVATLRRFWSVCVEKFTKQCDWIRFSHVFDTQRELGTFADGLRTSLEAFRAKLAAYRDQARHGVESFDLADSPTELVVVDRAYVDDMLKKKAELVDQRAASFFLGEGHAFSSYFTRWRADRSGVRALADDLRRFCADEMFSDVKAMGVIRAIRDTNYDLPNAVESVPVLLPLDSHARPQELVAIFGPEQPFLREQTAAISHPPVVLQRDGDEELLLVRVAHNVSLDSVTVLART